MQKTKQKNHLNVLKDHVGEWINSFVLLPRPTSSELDRVSWMQSLKIDHEAFCLAALTIPIGLHIFHKVSQWFKNHLDSRLTGKTPAAG